MWTQRQNGGKNLRFQKYPHTCGRGLSVYNQSNIIKLGAFLGANLSPKTHFGAKLGPCLFIFIHQIANLWPNGAKTVPLFLKTNPALTVETIFAPFYSVYSIVCMVVQMISVIKPTFVTFTPCKLLYIGTFTVILKFIIEPTINSAIVLHWKRVAWSLLKAVLGY